MKMKNSEATVNFIALADIINRKEKYPVKFAFAMTKNYKALESANKDFEEARNQLLDEYNVKNESGEPEYKATGKIEIEKGHESDWQNAVKELLEIETEVPVHTVAVSVLDGMEIEAGVLYACDFMLTDE